MDNLKKEGQRRVELDFGNKFELAELTPFWTDPKTGAELCEAPTSYVLREREGETWKQTFSVGRLMCQKAIPREAAIQMVTQGKSDLIQGFISKKGRPFDAFLLRAGPKISWEFPPRKPRVGKDGKTIERKAKVPPDLSKGLVIGESKLLKGEIVQTDDAYYIRKPDQEGRVAFTLKRFLCQKELPVEEVRELFENGRTNLIEGFISKRGSAFSAYLVLKKNKTEFEFPPR